MPTPLSSQPDLRTHSRHLPLAPTTAAATRLIWKLRPWLWLSLAIFVALGISLPVINPPT